MVSINMTEIANEHIENHSEVIDSIADKIVSENKEERIEAIETLLRTSAIIGYQFNADLDRAIGFKH